jgi:hypothetical protein
MPPASLCLRAAKNDSESQHRHHGGGERKVEREGVGRQAQDAAGELPQENAGALLETLLCHIAAQEAENPGPDADVGQIEQGERGREGRRQPPVPTSVDRRSGHGRKIFDQDAGRERDAREDRRPAIGCHEGQQQECDRHGVHVAVAGELPQRQGMPCID